MSQPIILSDEDDPLTPSPFFLKKRRTNSDPISDIPVLVLDDDPTPLKPSSHSTPSVVPETPISVFSSSEVSIVKCIKGASEPRIRVSEESISGQYFRALNFINMTVIKVLSKKFIWRFPVSINSLRDPCNSNLLGRLDFGSTVGFVLHAPSHQGIRGFICLESDNEAERSSGEEMLEERDVTGAKMDVMKISERVSNFTEASCSSGNTNAAQLSRNSSLCPTCLEDDYFSQIYDSSNKENVNMAHVDDIIEPKVRNISDEKKNCKDEKVRKKRMTIEERTRLMDENKIKKEQEKLRKAALKAEAAELKKLQKEQKKWEKGKLALKAIVVEIDVKVVESGSVGGHLLTRLAEKGLTFRVKSNQIERSIIWKMNIPELISQSSSLATEIQYVLLVLEADEFCNLVINEKYLDHVSNVRSLYPSYTIGYLTNRLMTFINRREQEHYKNPTNNQGWRRPPVEEVLAKLTTHFFKVHYRKCVDEAEVAEHVVGLTCSLASCQFRKKLTRLSVTANGSIISNDAVDRDLIKKNLWLKALVAIPKVQPRFALTIWKKYPTMKSLLSVYMDANKSVHEKEYLLKDLVVDGLLGEKRRLGEVCSKRVYRILMAQSGHIKTDEVEDGADFFQS